MADREPHEVLGVARDASEDEVRAAYREMVKKYHPDVSDAENAEERFVDIRDAYEVMRERAKGRGNTEDSKSGNGQVKKDTGTGSGRSEPERETRSSVRSEHKRREREKRKRWNDPWESETRNSTGGSDKKEKKKEDRKKRVDRLGYGWTLFREGDKFSVSKSGGRGNVYIDREGGMRREKYLFSSRTEAERAYEEHVRKREKRRNTFSLDGGWRMVQRASGYAVEGEEGYLGVDGNPQKKPYWFRSREEAKDVYEAYIRKKEKRSKGKESKNSDSLASRVTLGAALLPFLATVTILNVLSSSFGLGAKGKNPYLTTALTSAFFGTLAVVLKGYYPLLSFILLSLAVWAGVEFTVMIAGPYTADEIEG